MDGIVCSAQPLALPLALPFALPRLPDTHCDWLTPPRRHRLRVSTLRCLGRHLLLEVTVLRLYIQFKATVYRV